MISNYPNYSNFINNTTMSSTKIPAKYLTMRSAYRPYSELEKKEMARTNYIITDPKKRSPLGKTATVPEDEYAILCSSKWVEVKRTRVA